MLQSFQVPNKETRAGVKAYAWRKVLKAVECKAAPEPSAILEKGRVASRDGVAWVATLCRCQPCNLLSDNTVLLPGCHHFSARQRVIMCSSVHC